MRACTPKCVNWRANELDEETTPALRLCRVSLPHFAISSLLVGRLRHSITARQESTVPVPAPVVSNTIRNDSPPSPSIGKSPPSVGEAPTMVGKSVGKSPTPSKECRGVSVDGASPSEYIDSCLLEIELGRRVNGGLSIGGSLCGAVGWSLCCSGYLCHSDVRVARCERRAAMHSAEELEQMFQPFRSPLTLLTYDSVQPIVCDVLNEMRSSPRSISGFPGYLSMLNCRRREHGGATKGKNGCAFV